MKRHLDFMEFQQNGWWGPVMCETIRHLSSHVSVKLKSFKFKKWSNSNKTLLGVLKTGTGAEGGPVILNPCSEKSYWQLVHFLVWKTGLSELYHKSDVLRGSAAFLNKYSSK